MKKINKVDFRISLAYVYGQGKMSMLENVSGIPRQELIHFMNHGKISDKDFKMLMKLAKEFNP